MFFFVDSFKVVIIVQIETEISTGRVVLDQHTSGWLKEVLSLCCYSSREPIMPVSQQGEERAWSHFA